jgi:hypothetical protein
MGEAAVADEDEDDDEDPGVDAELLAVSYTPGMAARTMEIDGIPHRWCFTCKIWRKPGTVHCSHCGFCMEEYDHHCGVMGHCIAKKNHKFFNGLFLSVGVAGIVGAIGGIMRVVHVARTYESPFKEWSLYFAVLGTLYLGFMAVSFGMQGVGRCSSTCYFTTADMRSALGSEGLKKHYEAQSQRKCANWIEFWCANCPHPFGRFRRKTHPYGANRAYCWFH